MESPNPFEKLATLQEAELDARTADLARIRARMLSRLSARPGAAGRQYLLVAAAAVCAIAVGVVFASRLFVWNGVPAPVNNPPSRWLLAPPDDTAEMTFADGSAISLSAASSARVLQTAPHAVRVLLEQGEATVQVTRTGETSWLLEAGPFHVTVTGTRFSLSWNADDQVFALALHEGSVLIDGPMLKDPTRVTAGQQVTAEVTRRRFEISALDDPPEEDDAMPRMAMGPATSPSARTSTVVQGKHEDRPSPGPETAPRVPVGSAWQQLCAAGKFDQVVHEARQQGLQPTMETASLDDLMALGEAMRLTRNRMLSQQVYEAVRQRFAGTSQASTAAFHMGRTAFDQQHAYGVAAQWLETYLQEAPDGAFARDALGRLMEAQHKSGNRSAAMRSARTYLERYPDGVHATIATALVKEN
jgi:hypothetical protein